MSFMGRINSQFQQFGIGDKDNTRGQQPQQQSYQQQPQQYQQNYGYPAPNQPPPQYQNSYNMPPQQTASPPQAMPPPQPLPLTMTPLPYQTVPQPNQPTLPPGWTTLFDKEQQRWYFVEQASNRTQWDVPTHQSPPPPPAPPGPPAVLPPQEQTRGMDNTPGNYNNGATAFSPPPQPPPNYSSPAQGGNPQPQYPQDKNTNASKGGFTSGKKGMILGVGGGLVAGAVGAAALSGIHRRHEEEYEEAAYEYDD